MAREGDQLNDPRVRMDRHAPCDATYWRPSPDLCLPGELLIEVLVTGMEAEIAGGADLAAARKFADMGLPSFQVREGTP